MLTLNVDNSSKKKKKKKKCRVADRSKTGNKEGLNGSNRQPSNMENFNRQPSIKSSMINRQTSFIKDYYSVRQWC